MLFKEWSGRAIFLLMLLFVAAHAPKFSAVVSGEERCVCSYDGFGYYMYNPALFSKGSLFMSPEWAQDLQNEYCGGIEAYQLVKHKNEAHLDVYHMGLAYLQMPAYLAGEIAARIGGYPTDGFSTPYYIAYLLNVLLFTFLGLLYLRKLLRLFFSDQLSALLLLLTYLATNVYITFTQQYDLPHLYLFFLNAAFFYHLVRHTREGQRKHLIYAALLLGLSTAIRPTQALLGILPFILLYMDHRFSKVFWRKIALFPLFGLLWNIPQILYWQIVGGEPFITNLHTEDLVLSDPNLIDFLFSYRKGWLLYTPLFLLLIPGFILMYRRAHAYFAAIFLAGIFYLYVMSSWECWWYASSFSSRVMVDIYPLLLVVIGYLLLFLQRRWQKVAVGAFIGLVFILNVLQSWQYTQWYIHGSRMTKQQYWYVFGKIHIQYPTNIHLLIDRSDLSWPKRSYPSDQYQVVTKTIYSIPKPMQSTPGQDLTIGRLNLYELVDTDETQLTVSLKVKSSDTTQSSILRMETVSKYNCYSWDNVEVSKGIPAEGTTIQLVFNLPDIRHGKDQIQMYLDNDAQVSVSIEEMKIVARSLIRK